MNIIFEKGLLGLEQYKNYQIEDVENSDVYKILSSLDDKDISLAIISPFEAYKNYQVNIPKDTEVNLKISSEEDVILYTTVTLSSDIKKTTTNLRAPIVINKKTCLGEQIILANESYEIKHPIIEE